MTARYTDPVADRLAAQLRADQLTRRTYAPLQVDGRPLDSDLAYSVQHRLVALHQRDGAGACGGYKIGLTNPAMQRFCGVDQPVAGQILADRLLRDGASVATGDHVRLGIESELAVRLSAPLPASGDPAGLLQCIDRVAAAFELIDDRDADYATLDAFTIVAENSWNAGLALGDGVAPPGDLRDLDGRLTIDGTLVATGSSSDVMGDPLAVLAWLGQAAATLGYQTRAGQWIATGAIIPTVFPAPGQHFRFELTGMLPVDLQFA